MLVHQFVRFLAAQRSVQERYMHVSPRTYRCDFGEINFEDRLGLRMFLVVGGNALLDREFSRSLTAEGHEAVLRLYAVTFLLTEYAPGILDRFEEPWADVENSWEAGLWRTIQDLARQVLVQLALPADPPDVSMEELISQRCDALPDRPG